MLKIFSTIPYPSDFEPDTFQTCDQIKKKIDELMYQLSELIRIEFINDSITHRIMKPCIGNHFEKIMGIPYNQTEIIQWNSVITIKGSHNADLVAKRLCVTGLPNPLKSMHEDTIFFYTW
ncbi:MAG: hypothetical protein H9Q66_05685 [Spiroplasma ixodetis]|nr:hypothetical protein [Spiroplasma ixodetis]